MGDLLWPLLRRMLANFVTLEKIGALIRSGLLLVAGTLVAQGWVQTADLEKLAMVIAGIVVPVVWSLLNKEWHAAKVTAAASVPAVLSETQVREAATQIVKAGG